MRLAGRVPAPSVQRVVQGQARVELLQIVRVHARQAERHRQQTRRLGDEIEAIGVRAPDDQRQPRERLDACPARTPRPSRRRCIVRRDGSIRRLRCRTEWRPSVRRPPAPLRSARTGICAAGSTKRRISQGQAMRSTLGRARVTHNVRPSTSRAGSTAWTIAGCPAATQAATPPSSASAETPACRSQAAAPWLRAPPSAQAMMLVHPLKRGPPIVRSQRPIVERRRE